MSKALLQSLIEKFELNLSGLEVYTEAASGAYLMAPVLAALAGAGKVYAQTRDSRFSTADAVISETKKLARSFEVLDRIEFLTERNHKSLAKSDIITNSGFVRPIDRDLISSLKSTAVIPLMWETWEYRSSDFDLEFCKEKGILVLGTNESKPPCEMSSFIGLCGLKLLFELGFDGGKVLLLGNSPIPAPPMVEYMKRIGVEVVWVSTDDRADLPYENLREHFQEQGSSYDFIIVAEHMLKSTLIGTGGILDFQLIKEANSDIKIGIVSGSVSELELKASGIFYVPEQIAPVGFISYQPYMLGPRPVLTLFAAGLRVGQVMSRSRLNGESLVESVLNALVQSPAMDFDGELSWLQ